MKNHLAIFFLLLTSIKSFCQNTDIQPNRVGLPAISSAERAILTNIKKGTILYDSDLGTVVVFDGNYWKSLVFSDNQSDSLVKLGEFQLAYQAYSLATFDNLGNIILTGFINTNYRLGDNLILGNSSYTSYIAKFQADGLLLWHKTFGGSDEERLFCISTDASNNIYIGGSFRTNFQFDNQTFIGNANFDSFILKINSNGNFVWFFHPNAVNYDEISKIQISSNLIYFGGNTLSSIDLGNGLMNYSGGSDIFVGILNFDAQLQDSKTIGGIGTDRISSLEINQNDQLFLGGTFSNSFSIPPITVTNTSPFSNAFIAKFTNGLGINWVSVIAASESFEDSSVKFFVDAVGNVHYTVVSNSPPTIAGITLNSGFQNRINYGKLSQSGQLLWNKSDGSGALKVLIGLLPDNGKIKLCFKQFSNYPNSQFNIATSSGVGFFMVTYDSDGVFKTLTNLNNNSSSEVINFVKKGNNNILLGVGQSFTQFGKFSIPTFSSYPYNLILVKNP